MAGYGAPFSSPDGISDEAWDNAVRSWRDAQGLDGSVAGAQPVMDPGIDRPPIGQKVTIWRRARP